MIADKETKKILIMMYDKLRSSFGPQIWWPGDTPFEIITGIILSQNASWKNSQKAVTRLRNRGLLEAEKLFPLTTRQIANIIKPVGYYNLKARRIRAFLDFLFSRYQGSIKAMFKQDYWRLRAALLDIRGIGLETADTMLLYAGRKPVFVVDNYTKRILTRHNLVENKATYSEVQSYFMDNLPEDARLYSEFHSLMVHLGKRICRKRPLCKVCPLRGLDQIVKYTCDSCGKRLNRGELRYVLKMELYAAPEVVITEEDLKKDLSEEIKRLAEITKGMSKKDLSEEVFVSYKLTLCKNCRDILARRISHKEFV